MTQLYTVAIKKNEIFKLFITDLLNPRTPRGKGQMMDLGGSPSDCNGCNHQIPSPLSVRCQRRNTADEIMNKVGKMAELINK